MTSDNTGYRWHGIDRHGKRQCGHMLTANAAQVRVNLHHQGIRATRVTQTTALPSTNRRRRWRSGPRISTQDLHLITQQTANMLSSGLPLLQALSIVGAGSEHPRVRQLLTTLHDRVATGGSFSEALAEHPQYFDRLFISLLSIGEQTGTMDTALERIAACQQRDAVIVSQLRKALSYPLAVLATAIVVTAVLLIKVVPQFAVTFTELGAPLPALTQTVMNLSALVIRYGWLWLAVLGGGVLGCGQVIRRHSGARRHWHHLLLRLPVFGVLVRDATLARICRTLATTMAAGLTIVDALRLSAAAAGNLCFQKTCLDILADVEQGQSLGFSIRKTGAFPVMITQLTHAGEQSGTLDSMLARCADHYERRVEELLDRLTGLLEPLIMVTLGLLVGGLMVAMYLPIFRLGAAL